MALDTYANLQTALTDHIGNRGDVTAATIKDFITMAEAKMRRVLMVRPMVGRSTAMISNPYEAVPNDYGGPITFTLTGTSPPVALRWTTPERLSEMLQSDYTSSGQPIFYTVIGGEFAFCPTLDTSYAAQIVYYKDVPALSDSNTTNWILTLHPDVYVNGSLAQAGVYMVDDPRLGTWASAFLDGLNDISANSLSDSSGGDIAPGSTFAP